MSVFFSNDVARNFTFTTENDEISITGYIGSRDNVTIPSRVNGFPVTGVGEYSFGFRETLMRVSIPDSVVIIDHGAFIYTNIQSVNIPERLTCIGEGAFAHTNLIEVTIPARVSSIGHFAFGENKKLTDITVSDNNPVYSSVDGVLFNKDKTRLIQYPSSRIGDSYEIPETVETIAFAAFQNSAKLHTVLIPEGVKYIKEGAFASCVNLRTVNIPESVISIEANVFVLCNRLQGRIKDITCTNKLKVK